jgi:hypothetical protein
MFGAVNLGLKVKRKTEHWKVIFERRCLLFLALKKKKRTRVQQNLFVRLQPNQQSPPPKKISSQKVQFAICSIGNSL